jgi:hypothetical protein
MRRGPTLPRMRAINAMNSRSSISIASSILARSKAIDPSFL